MCILSGKEARFPNGAAWPSQVLSVRLVLVLRSCRVLLHGPAPSPHGPLQEVGRRSALCGCGCRTRVLGSKDVLSSCVMLTLGHMKMVRANKIDFIRKL